MESMRRAALCLHALSPADRRWMLRMLPDEQSVALKSMLHELKAMGIPRDPDLVGLKDAVESDSAVLPERQAAARERVDKAELAALASVLEGEPRELVAAVIGGEEWSWQKALLKTYAPVERRWLSEIATKCQQDLPVAVRECLIDLVSSRLPEEGQGLTRTHPRPWWRWVGGSR